MKHILSGGANGLVLRLPGHTPWTRNCNPQTCKANKTHSHKPLPNCETENKVNPLWVTVSQDSPQAEDYLAYMTPEVIGIALENTCLAYSSLV